MSEPIVPAVREQRTRFSQAEAARAPGFRFVAVAALLAAISAAFLWAAAAQARPLSRADRAFVDATVEAAMQEEGQPGVEISISGPKGDYTRAYGVRDLSSGAPLRLADHVRIGSITKTFTGTAILEQVQEHHLKLSDTLDKWVSGIPYGDSITVRDLLAMKSGVFEYEADAGLQQKFTEDPTAPFTREEFLQILRSHQPEFAPGEHTQYNNSNFILLGLILEGVTGERAEAAITRDVIWPLGLHHTSFPTTPRMPFPYAHGYCAEGGPLVDCTAFNPDLFWTDGAIVSTVGDLAKYARELGTGALLTRRMQEKRLQFSWLPYAFEGPSVFGYGLGILSFGNWLGHDGSVPGFGTEAMYEPRTGAVIAGAETLQTPTLAIFSRIYERIAAHLYPESLENPQPYPEYVTE